MKLRTFVQTTTFAVATLITCGAMAADKMGPDQLLAATKKGGAMVSAIKPTDAPLSEGDKELFMEVAKGGMMQLEVSKVAEKKATSPEVKAMAAAEVDEQTGLSKKLKEIAAAKKVMLPKEPDAMTTKEVEKLNGLSGAEFDQAYVKDSGVKGHEILHKTMTKVQKEAKDPDLKAVEQAAHPLVMQHLEYAKSLK